MRHTSNSTSTPVYRTKRFPSVHNIIVITVHSRMLEDNLVFFKKRRRRRIKFNYSKIKIVIFKRCLPTFTWHILNQVHSFNSTGLHLAIWVSRTYEADTLLTVKYSLSTLVKCVVSGYDERLVITTTVVCVWFCPLESIWP